MVQVSMQVEVSDIKLSAKDGSVVVSSRQVAEKFGKRHDNVLRLTDDKLYSLDASFSRLNFEESTYVAGSGKSEREILMTRDGFIFIVMGFTGTEADTWKIKFIQAFNAMEAELLKPTQKPAFALPTTFVEALRALVVSEEAKMLAEQLRDVAVEANEFFAGRDANLLSLQDAMREIGIRPNKGIEWLRLKGYLTKSNFPTAQATALKGEPRFKVISVDTTFRGCALQTKVTGPGLIWLRDDIKWPCGFKVGTFKVSKASTAESTSLPL
jgi:Rha family phage regulatory protein